MSLNPTFENLKRITPGGRFFSQNMHPNPRFYKYYWHVFSGDCKVEGQEFFRNYRMSTCEAHLEIIRLRAKGEPFMVYNFSRPRRGPDSPFNESKAKNWAPAYDDDTDMPWRKDGHK